MSRYELATSSSFLHNLTTLELNSDLNRKSYLMMQRSLTTILLLFGVMLQPSGAVASDKAHISLKDIINIAGSQRMLSQRIVKQYSQIALDVFPDDSKKEIDRSIVRFEDQLIFLKHYSNDDVFQETLEWVTIAWNRFKPLVTDPVSRDNIRRINHLSEDLLYVTNKVVNILQDIGNRPADRLVNIAGRQRMLSQRLAKIYLLQSWGFDSLSLGDELKRASRQFDEVLERLRRAPETTPEIALNIEQAITQWIWFQNVLEQHGDASYRLIVADASDSLLQMMDTVTTQYAEIDE